MSRAGTHSNDTTTPKSWVDFVKGRDRLTRSHSLEQMRKAGATFPICLAEDLLRLDISIEEKYEILQLTYSDNLCAYEHFLTRYLLDWSQELAGLAVRIWCERTEHHLWFRFVKHCNSTLITQRVLYTLVDHAQHTGGSQLISRATTIDGLLSLSSAFHGLLLHRAVQWSAPHPILAALSQRILVDMNAQYHPEHKAIPSALAYLLRFHADEAPKEIARMRESPWREIIHGLVNSSANFKQKIHHITKITGKNSSKDRVKQLDQYWPPLYGRGELPVEVVNAALQIVISQESPPSGFDWTYFSGIPETTLTAAVESIQDQASYARALSTIEPLLTLPVGENLLAEIRKRFPTTEQASQLLPPRLRLAIYPSNETDWHKIQQEQTATLFALASGNEFHQIATAEINDWSDHDSDGEILSALNFDRKNFFHHAFNGPALARSATTKSTHDPFWQLLIHAWEKPEGQLLSQLAQASRPIEGIFRLCYIATLGRFHGEDQAALKLLDFIRTRDEDELRAVIYALAGIGTPRALQELVASITRPNITVALQLEICSLLAEADVSNLQSEIRSAIKDQNEKSDDSASEEVREALANLLSPVLAEPDSVKSSGVNLQSDTQLDAMLGSKIRYYKELSSEVKRALRTSQFFHIQVSFDDAPEAIDLSPVIDMQYKALELLFRECFEDHCARLIQRGVLQRRLDVIGYARPIPSAMTEFEDYIGSLPVVRDIPFFSKFKLRKTLRAICQFRPGKRFTLDGLKAFALFFLCFGRSQCKHGLGGLFPLGFKDDLALCEFVKTLHMMQDFRNRAAHEGFHPDASNDIDGIWRDTAQIIQTAIETRQFLDQGLRQDSGTKRTNDQTKSVIIERKKVS